MWNVKLTEKQLNALRDLLRRQGDLGPTLSGVREAVELARFDELPEAQLPWAAVSEAAERQGISEADIVWDLSGHGRAAA